MHTRAHFMDRLVSFSPHLFTGTIIYPFAKQQKRADWNPELFSLIQLQLHRQCLYHRSTHKNTGPTTEQWFLLSPENPHQDCSAGCCWSGWCGERTITIISLWYTVLFHNNILQQRLLPGLLLQHLPAALSICKLPQNTVLVLFFHRVSDTFVQFTHFANSD